MREDKALPLAVAQCVEAAEYLAKVIAAPADESPALIARRRDLEQLRELAARNPALQEAVLQEQQQIAALSQERTTTIDPTPYLQALRDPAFFSEASPAEQRALFRGVLQHLLVAPGGKVRAVPRSC